MTDSRLARRPAAPAPVQQQPGRRAFGALPPAKSNVALERALELAGVDATEMALLASTTFREAQSLEELVTLIATTRRRGLDGLLKHVYYERFGGQSSDPSLHVAIDGLRTIAAATGRYGGRSEPRFSDVWDMPLEDGKTKQVPAKCSMTVYAIVQNRQCAFEGVAWMEEAYPGSGLRGRMWRQRPRGMLAIAAERQALRSAFPAETAGIGDTDEAAEPEAAPPRRTAAQIYERIYAPEENWAPQQRTVVNTAGDTVEPGTGEVVQERKAAPKSEERQVKVGDLEAEQLAKLVERAAAVGVTFDDLRVGLPAPREQVIRAIERLQDRVQEGEARARQYDDMFGAEEVAAETKEGN